MIEFSRIKKVTIKEGIVKKITNSSGVVLWKAANDTSGDTSSITVDLNNQWVESTKKLDGYLVYMSNSNKGVANGYASMKIKFKGEPDFKIWINSYAEAIYDYTIAFNMDVDYPTSLPDTNSTGVKLHTGGFQKDPTTIDNFKEVDYPNDGGEHFVVVTYRKDGGGDVNDDRGYVAIKLGALLSTSWVVSSTEFIKENDKYYQRLNEIGTYEGGLTTQTGNFKKGNELAPTYIQSSDAKDFIVVDGGIYYKKYAWVTPVDTAINTGDYIQGDYIGEATPSMKVTYTDNTEKAFYNLTSIEKDTDANKANAKNVEIYDSIASIGSNAFSFCSSLSAITIPNSVTSIGSSAFDSCSRLSEIKIPNSVTSIADSTFHNCSSLSAITIPNSVTSIRSNAFHSCSSLSAITIPNSVTSIGDWAFSFCSSLSAITIPNSVTSIGSSAFNRCSRLSAITIPNSVTSIGSGTFYGCSSLSSVIIENSSSKLEYNTNAFANISSTAKLYVPSNLLADYQADTKWTGAFPGGIYAIPKNETVVTYTDGTTKEFDIKGELQQNSIENLSAATKVDIGNSVTSLGTSSLAYLNNLTSVKIPDSVTDIGISAFFDDSKLSSIDIGSGVTKIGDYALKSCQLLEVINFKGTSSQWNAITKGKDWHYGIPAIVVHCSDRDVTL